MRGFMGSSKDFAGDTGEKKKKIRAPRKAKLAKDIVGKLPGLKMPKSAPIKTKPISASSKRKKTGLFG